MALKKATVFLALLFLLSVSPSIVSGADGENFPRHINPSRIEGESPGSRALFQIYSLNLKSISAENWENAEHFLHLADYAYLPSDLQPLNLELLNANRNLKVHLQRSDLNIDNALASFSSSDFSRAREELFEARFSLAKAKRSLRKVDLAGEELGAEMGTVPDFFTENLMLVENILQSYNSTLQVLLEGGDWENVPDVVLPTDDLERLENLIGENIEGGFPGIGELISGENLIETEITIGMDRDRAQVGMRVRVEGKLRTEDGRSLNEREVSIYLDGRKKKSVLTNEGGRYSAGVRIPYVYRDEISFRSAYLPEGKDLGTFTPAVSEEIPFALLYSRPAIEIEAPGKVYPGRSFKAEGKLTLEREPLSNLSVNVSWLGATENLSTGQGGGFLACLSVPPGATIGPEEVKVESLPKRTVGPASVKKTVRITKLDSNLSFDDPNLSLLGADLTITGEIRVDGEPVENSRVLLEMGNRTASARSSEEGKFRIILDTSLSSFSGRRGFSIHVYPGDPWVRTTGGEGEILFLNPLTILIVLIVVVSLFAFRRRSGRDKKEPTGSAEIDGEEPLERANEKRLEGIKGLFVRAVKTIAEVTELPLKKTQTIRDYLSEVRGKIGRAYGPFERLALKFEEYLYSNHKVEGDRSLSEKIMDLLGRGER